MFILLEWLLTIVLFFLSLGLFNGENYYGNNSDYNLATLYLISSIVLFVMAIMHTKIFYDNDDNKYNDKYNWNYYDYQEGNSSHQRYMQTNTTWNIKTTKEVVADISKEYKITPTIINEVKQIEIKKKPSIFSFGKKIEPKTYIPSSTETNEYVSIEEAMEEFDVKPDFSLETHTTVELSNEKKEIYNALLNAIKIYVPSDLSKHVISNIINVDKNNDTVVIQYHTSNNVDMKRYISSNALIKSMREELNIKEIGKIKFREIEEVSFAEYCSENNN